jgi:hypothetical protein
MTSFATERKIKQKALLVVLDSVLMISFRNEYAKRKHKQAFVESYKTVISAVYSYPKITMSYSFSTSEYEN